MHPFILTHNAVSDLSPLELIEAAARSGYSGVSMRMVPTPLFPFFPVAGDKKMIGDIKQALKRNNVSLFEILTLYLEPDFHSQRYIPALEAGAELGATFALATCADPDPNRRSENLARLGEAGEQFGLTIGFTYAMATEVRSMDETLSLLKKAGSPNVGLVVDTAQLDRCDEGIAELKRAPLELYRYVQFTDRKAHTDQICPAGEGDLALKEILTALPDEIPLVLEVPPTGKNTLGAVWADHLARQTSAYLGH
ncbi:sugar phosphate isomerase/epimerase family protein [Sinorhizobium medicae]|uniref:sugar phosphate isomerase/epimerase family protein n=1 Tax=Sinorhizobium medicae TaxID=110321 RepID=UPI000FD80A84|nr:sugar phosphate isomerase/epimerase [Sinorhizobium medicae]RVO73524.1 sugar phosphate isomerase/epimerase [Sinorhizobium medicae]